VAQFSVGVNSHASSMLHAVANANANANANAFEYACRWLPRAASRRFAEAKR
jgi:hypothetical protein